MWEGSLCSSLSLSLSVLLSRQHPLTLLLGFLVVTIDLSNGVIYLDNVTYFYDCDYLSPQSMVVYGDLIPIQGGSMKGISSIECETCFFDSSS